MTGEAAAAGDDGLHDMVGVSLAELQALPEGVERLQQLHQVAARAAGLDEVSRQAVKGIVVGAKLVGARDWQALVRDAQQQAPTDEHQEDKKSKTTQADLLVSLAEDRYRFVTGTDGKPYGVELGGSVAFPMKQKGGIRQKLARAYRAEYGSVVSSSALADAMNVIEDMASDNNPEPVWLRTAKTEDGRIVLDLADAAEPGKAVIVDRGKWWIDELSPVLFRRTKLIGPIADPVRPPACQRGYDLALNPLRRLLNVSEPSFRLVIGWEIAGLIPGIPHPILVLIGEQGTAKTTALKTVTSLIDPSPVPVRKYPRDEQAWVVTANAGWVSGLDNLSNIPRWLSDALCRAVTGDGDVGRLLYSDDDVSVIAFQRVIAYTTIDVGAVAGDLAERQMAIDLEVIPPSKRRTDAEVAKAVAAARPAALGAILDLLSKILDRLDDITLDEMPRMADFSLVLAALDQVTGWGTLSDYTSRVTQSSLDVVSNNPVAVAIEKLLAEQEVGWAGTPTELMQTISPQFPPPTWPKDATRLSGELRRLAPHLRTWGVGIAMVKSNGVRLIKLESLEKRESLPR